MDLITTIVVSVICALFATEVYVWAPRFSRYLAVLAAKRLPKTQHEIYLEQWLAELDNIPGAVSQLGYAFGLHVCVFGLKRVYGDQPRIFDIICSTIFIILFFPLLILVSFLIRLEGKCPVLYKARVRDLRGEQILLWKFSTFNLDNDAECSLYLEFCGKVKNDDAIVRPSMVGAILRRTGIDLLPQVFNIFRGDVSLIGPPVIIPECFDQFTEELSEQNLLLHYKYGLFSPSRVFDQHSHLTDVEKFRVDLHYMRDRSLSSDLHLLLRALQK